MYEKLWRHCGQSAKIGEFFTTLALTADDHDHVTLMMSLAQKGIEVLSAEANPSMETKMWLGACYSIAGCALQMKGIDEQAGAQYRKGIKLMEDCRQDRVLRGIHKDYIMKDIAEAKGEYSAVLLLRNPQSAEGIYNCKRALLYTDFLHNDDIKDRQATLAHVAFRRAVKLRTKGQVTEASIAFSEAEDLFHQSADHQGTVTSIIAYGYFLYFLRRYSEAARILGPASVKFRDDSIETTVFHATAHVLTSEIKYEVHHTRNEKFELPTSITLFYFYAMSVVKLSKRVESSKTKGTC